MFTAQQLAYVRALAGESAGNAQITFTRSRLLIKTGSTDEDYQAVLLFLFMAGIMVAFGAVIAGLTHTWLLAVLLVLGLFGLYWLGRRTLTQRQLTQQAPPHFVFDLLQQSFYIRTQTPDGSVAPQFTRYPSRALAGIRVIILSSSQYSDDTVVELSFGEGNWVRVLRLTNSPLAYRLEEVIRRCATFR